MFQTVRTQPQANLRLEMMFDSLVCPLSSDLEDGEEGEEARRDSFEIFKGSTKSLCEEVLMTKTSLEDYEFELHGKESKDPILKYLRRYYQDGPPGDQLDTEADLSWDEGDMPQLCPKVWTFNDFMEQYNNIYAWLNNIQVQYHSDKRGSGNSPRVEVMLRELEKDVEKRERFLRECGRMVGSYPELEEEVRWRLDHVMTKWDMLTQLRTKSRNNINNIQDVYSDIELEVKCLRRWLREMEARIDPLQFSKIQCWSALDRERKMAEYQVLQTDIESHGRIVKLVVGLCEELSHNPGQYDLQHAVKVASGLERRWHQIWLRSLEWQCLLEQWLTKPYSHSQEEEEGTVLDTDEEPLAKVARLNTDCDSLNSPAVTLLRRKRRKRMMINLDLSPEEAHIMDPEKRIKLKSPRTPRNLTESDYDDGDQIVVSMTTESDPSAPSTSRSESSDSVTFVFSQNKQGVVVGDEHDSLDNASQELSYQQWQDDNLNIYQRATTPVQNPFITNTMERKVTMILNPKEVEANINLLSQESADSDNTARSLDLTDVGAGADDSSSGTSSDKQFYSQENINAPVNTNNLEMLHFGEDYRLFISSLSDSSVASQSRYRNKKLRRKNKRREMEECFPYESQSEAEMDCMFHVVSQSQRELHGVEGRVTEFISQGFVRGTLSQEYDDILASCSENINVLHNFLETIHTTESFVTRKKSRETRLLISRWEKVLQKLLDNVNNSKVFDKLKDECKHLRESTIILEDNIQCAISQVDLQTQMRKLKAIQDQLSGQKAKMDQLIISLHNFLAELGCSSSVEDCHLALAETLKTEVVGLYSHWDSCNTRAVSALAQAQQAVLKLHDIERDLVEFRKTLRAKQNQLLQKNRKKTVLRNLKVSQNSLHDSGISEGSSGFLSDYGLPEALEHLSRLKEMTRSLEKTLSPHDPTLQTLSSILKDTSLELDDLQKMYLKQKTNVKKKPAKHFPSKGGPGNRATGGGGKDPLRPSRTRKFVRLTVTLQVVLGSLLLLSWLCRPQCCDTISAISFSPHFKFVNGPPPI